MINKSQICLTEINGTGQKVSLARKFNSLKLHYLKLQIGLEEDGIVTNQATFDVGHRSNIMYLNNWMRNDIIDFPNYVTEIPRRSLLYTIDVSGNVYHIARTRLRAKTIRTINYCRCAPGPGLSNPRITRYIPLITTPFKLNWDLDKVRKVFIYNGV